MANTPQLTLRVSKDKLGTWKAACQEAGVSVSEQLRHLMDIWVTEQESIGHAEPAS